VDIIVFGIWSYCVTPDTSILCADLVWRPAGSLQIGQEIVAFDEDPSFGNNRRVARRYRTATIEINAHAVNACSRVTTDIGDPVVASDDHPWLAWAKNRSRTRTFINGHCGRKAPRTAGLEWKTTSELCAGEKIAFLSHPWAIENSRSAGWLAGMFDGEGSLSKATGNERLPHYKINISQNPGALLDRLRNELRQRNFTFYENVRSCPQLVLTGGWAETLRFLGQVAPDRLAAKVPTIMAELPGLFRDKTFTLAEITSVAPVGNHPVASIRTSRSTLITGGYLAHDTYQYVTRDRNGFAMKATWAQLNDTTSSSRKTCSSSSGRTANSSGVPHSPRSGRGFSGHNSRPPLALQSDMSAICWRQTRERPDSRGSRCASNSGAHSDH